MQRALHVLFYLLIYSLIYRFTEDSGSCGKRKATKFLSESKGNLDQIIGGQLVKQGQWPWMALISNIITSKGIIRPFCGGNLHIIFLPPGEGPESLSLFE